MNLLRGTSHTIDVFRELLTKPGLFEKPIEEAKDWDDDKVVKYIMSVCKHELGHIEYQNLKGAMEMQVNSALISPILEGLEVLAKDKR